MQMIETHARLTDNALMAMLLLGGIGVGSGTGDQDIEIAMAALAAIGASSS
jgi:uncharacterized protein GlcG (DUF336 family)